MIKSFKERIDLTSKIKSQKIKEALLLGFSKAIDRALEEKDLKTLEMIAGVVESFEEMNKH